MTTSEKVREAADLIGASGSSDNWTYRASETGEWYRLTQADLLALYALVHDADEIVRGDAYSLWCSSHGELIGDDARAKAVGVMSE